MSKICTKDITLQEPKSAQTCKLKKDSSKKDKEFVTAWINSSNFSDDDEDSNSIISDSTAVSSSCVESEDCDFSTLSIDDAKDCRKMSLTSSSNNTSCLPTQSDILQHIFNKDSSVQTLGNVRIENSSNVHIGNVTYITGPMYITNPQTVTKLLNDNTKTVPSSSSTSSKVFTEEDEENISQREEAKRDDAFLGNHIRRRIAENVLHIVDRRRWLAQKPMEPYDFIEKPVELVIISHSATEMGSTMADNIYLIRNIQCFHIESCRWNDIAYNFMIGNDGNVYEGRGWAVVGAHARGYNSTSMGISFVGCFMRELPPAISLAACKKLIQKGIDKGHITPDYKLIGHCQCSSTESPGRRLFEEIQTWDHFCTDLDI